MKEPKPLLTVAWCPECGRANARKFGKHFIYGSLCPGVPVELEYFLTARLAVDDEDGYENDPAHSTGWSS